MRLGKLPHTPDHRDLLFRDYAGSLPSRPAAFGHESMVDHGIGTDWGVLGNDRHGDCVFAGAAHETMLWNAEAGRNVAFDAQHVLADYGAVTGFDPHTGANDNGTNVRDALKYRQSTGVADANGKRHKIGAYVAIEPGDWDAVLEAVYLFGVIGIGFLFPDYAMDQFNAGRSWSYHRTATPTEGHYVPVVGHHSALYLTTVTWGCRQRMTKAFFQHFCDEAYAFISPEMLTAGKSLEGFDVEQLNADLQALRA